MSTRIIEQPLRPKSPVRRAAPKSHPASWIAVLLATDISLFVAATALGALVGFHNWHAPLVVRHLVFADIAYVALWIVVFDRLGLYRRTYALSMKDELYYTVAALCLGTIPQLVLFTIFPYISTSRSALLWALLFSIVTVGSARAVLHRVRASRRFSRHRRTTIVGTASRIGLAAQSLEIASNIETQLVVVDDIDESVSHIDLTRDRDLEAVDWFTRARAWGS